MKIVLLPLFLFSLGCASHYSAKDSTTTPKASKKTSRYSKRVPAQHSGDNSLLSRFRNSVNFESGTYLPENDPTESCYDGEIELLEIDDTISVMIGGRLLVGDIKMPRNQFGYEERGCKNNVMVDVVGNRIKRKHVQNCPKGDKTMTAKVEFQGSVIKYDLQAYEGKKRVIQIQCTLQRVVR
jgi:hypothetical protein